MNKKKNDFFCCYFHFNFKIVYPVIRRINIPLMVCNINFKTLIDKSNLNSIETMETTQNNVNKLRQHDTYLQINAIPYTKISCINHSNF